MPFRQQDAGGTAVSLSVRGLSVIRKTGPVLHDITLTVPRGQRLALLGPPGAGQGALLLALAGLLPVRAGTVLFDGRDVTRLRPGARGAGLALSVPPAGLFSGRRLRRLAPSPAHGLLLLDEPLAWPERGPTVVAVLRDQALALSGADRIAVLREGRVVQDGAPAAVYERPASGFVARFLGGANTIAATVRELWPDRIFWVAQGQRFQLAVMPGQSRPPLGTKLLLALRSERIALLIANETADNMTEGRVTAACFEGPVTRLATETPIGALDVLLAGWPAARVPPPGAAVRLGWASDAAQPVAED